MSNSSLSSKITHFSAWFTLFVGFMTLLGWYFDVPVFRSLATPFSSMSHTTAVCFIVIGLANLLYLRGHPRRASGLGLIVALLAGLTLIEIIFARDFGIDRLFFFPSHPLYAQLEQMSPVTAFNMLLLGIVTTLGMGRASVLFGTLMLVLVSTSAVGLLGLLYSVASVYALPAYKSMAFTTAFTFIVQAFSYFFARPSPLLTILRSPTSAGLTGRRLLPLALSAPLLLGWALMELVRRGVFDDALGFALLVLLTTIVFVLVIGVTMRAQYAEELLRQTAAQDALEFALHRERNRLLKEFVTNTLHDLRTPLSSIGTSAYIAGRTDDAAKRGERLEHIQTEVRQLGKLLDQFAEMVRLNQMEDVVLTPTALNPLVERTVAEYQVLAERKGLRVVTEIYPGELIAPISELLLQTALIQVLNNAVRYTPSGGMITVRTHCRDTHALIEIADTGEGIPAAALQRVFDVQYKGNAARTADGSTGGIGLSMVRRILELHHGRVDITSSVGHGTTVWLFIPVHTPPTE